MENSGIKLESLKDKASYGLGVSVAQNLMNQNLKDINLTLFMLGMEDSLEHNSSRLPIKEIQAAINEFAAAGQSEAGGDNAEEGKKFLEENGKRDGVVVLPSGLQYEILKEGDGPKPSPTSQVTTHYHGTLITGEVFDSSVNRGEPATFPVNGVIQGWQEALPLMPTGSKWKLFVPSDLAYGPRGAGGMIGPNATLIFEVELLAIV